MQDKINVIRVTEGEAVWWHVTRGEMSGEFETLADYVPNEALAEMFARSLDMHKALKIIASTPLWGERIEEKDLRDEYADSGEYSREDDEFTPSGDTECNMLRDAVELARDTIKPHKNKPKD